MGELGRVALHTAPAEQTIPRRPAGRVTAVPSSALSWFPELAKGTGPVLVTVPEPVLRTVPEPPLEPPRVIRERRRSFT